jgi:MoaA/NifB/PqqE/SkfB family radical SAM enzyme
VKHSISLWLEIENRCNLACRFCYNFWRDGAEPAPRSLSTTSLLQGLDSLLEQFDCRQVAISGGEPLLHADLEDIVLFLKSRKLRVIITTNGSLLTAEKADAMLEWGVDSVQVSLHSSAADEHDWLSAGRSFRAAVGSLMLLRERGIGVAGVFVATNRNLQHFPDTLRLLARIDVRTIIFNRFIVSGLGVRNRQHLGVPDDVAVLEMLQRAELIATKHRQTIVMGTPVAATPEARRQLPSVRFGSCPVGRGQTRWTIGGDGEIRRCNHSSVSIGNILVDGISELVRIYAESAAVSDPLRCGQCQLNSAYFRRDAGMAVV